MTDRIIPLDDFLCALHSTQDYGLLDESIQKVIDERIIWHFTNDYSGYDSIYRSVKLLVEQDDQRCVTLDGFASCLVSCCHVIQDRLFGGCPDQVRKRIVHRLLDKVNPVVAPLLAELANTGILHFSIASFYRQFPFHYRQCIHIMGCLLQNTRICLDRFYADYSEESAFFKCYQPPITDIDYLDSDPHNGHQSVICLTLSNNQKLVYKPRSLDGEAFLNSVLSAVNDRVLNAKSVLNDNRVLNDNSVLNADDLNGPMPAVSAIEEREDHGWMKWVEPSEISMDSKGLAMQMGALLAVSCTISLADLHCENICLGKEGVTVIDAEAINILYPDITHKLRGRYPTVIDLGMLPGPEGRSVNEWWDISVLGVTAGWETLPIGFTFDGSTGRLNIRYHTISNHYSVIKERLSSLSGEEMSDALIKGFEQGCAALAGISPITAKKDDFRYIHRPTSAYFRSLLRLTDAAFGADINLLAGELAVYCKECGNKPGEGLFFDFIDIVAREITSLIHGDIPRFTKSDLQQAAGIKFPELIWKLPDPSFSKQAIAISLKLIPELENGVFSLRLPRITTDPDPKKQLKIIADNIMSDFCLSGEGIPFGIHSNRESGIPTLSRINSSLYNGVSGMLFPLGLAIYAGLRGYEPMFNALVDYLYEEFVAEIEGKDICSLSHSALGAIYILSYLLKIDPANDLREKQLDRFVEWVPHIEWAADQFDVVSGIAGCLLIFNSLPVSFKNGKVNMVREQLTTSLLDGQTRGGGWSSLGKKGLCGFSHGAAGIRYALGSALTQGIGPEKRIRAAINKAVCFEQAEFNTDKNNWKDLRYHGNSHMRNSHFSAWCHGAAGIGLAEVGLRRMGLDYLPERIAPSFASSNRNVFNRQSVCCGVVALAEMMRLSADELAAMPVIGAQGAMPVIDMREAMPVIGLRETVTAIGGLKPSTYHREEINAPLSLFKAYWGFDLIRAVNGLRPGMPSLLLLE